MRDRSAAAAEQQQQDLRQEDSMAEPWQEAVAWHQPQPAAVSSTLQSGDDRDCVSATDHDRVSGASTVAQAGSEYRVLPSTTESVQGMSLRSEASATHQARSGQGHKGGRQRRRHNLDKAVEATIVTAATRRLNVDNPCSTTVFCAVLLLPLVLLGVSLTLLSLRGGRARRAAQAFAGISNTLHGLCVEGAEDDRNRSALCRETLERLSHSMKADTDPCDDFYEHVCGNWKPRYPNRPSYLKEHLESFNVLVHETLLSLATSAPPHWVVRLAAAVHQMAVFHNSCYAMAAGHDRGGNAADVATALGTDVSSWVDVVSHEALLDLAVKTTQNTGLPAFLSVTKERGTMYIHVGATLQSTLRFQHKVSEFLVQTLAAFDVHFKFHFSRLFDMDRDMTRILESSAQERSMTRQRESVLSPIQIHPTMAALRSLGNSTSHMLGNFRGDSAAMAAIARLRSEPLPTAGIYALSVLLAQPSTSVRSTPKWVARKFQKHEAVATVRGLFADIRVLLMRDNRVNRGVLVDAAHLKRTQLLFYGQDSMKAIFPPAPQFHARMGHSFLPNLAVALRSRVGRRPSDDRSADFVLSGYLGYHGDSFVVTPAYLSGHGVLALRVDEVDVFYPTVAALMLRAIYEDSAFYSPTSLANYTEGCFSESVSFALGRYVAPHSRKKKSRHSIGLNIGEGCRRLQVLPFMGSRWATFFASFLSRRRAADVQRRLGDRGRAHLYFRLACFLGCGDTALRDTCNDVAYSSDDLALSLGCRRERRIKCDCDRLDNCETHVPRA
ncbi:hypothetical protein HPB49_005954 [Dermacentor silvarum]|uniref:Uncharacterized protein n=1 Tax=Dermacentor silvarum TaxID=543639 RepID=A0ACB8DVN8_DERSI|nr:hypothetical protein HPB49_005954 [Dermacentor silvarum]